MHLSLTPALCNFHTCRSGSQMLEACHASYARETTCGGYEAGTQKKLCLLIMLNGVRGGTTSYRVSRFAEAMSASDAKQTCST